MAYDRLYGPTLVNTDLHTLKVVLGGWRGNTGGWWEVFATEDSLFMLSYNGCYVNPLGTNKLLPLCPLLLIDRSNVSIVDRTARWIDGEHTVWS